MKNAMQGKPRRRLKRARRAVAAFLARDLKAKDAKKTTAIGTRALFIPNNDDLTADAASVALARIDILLAATL